MSDTDARERPRERVARLLRAEIQKGDYGPGQSLLPYRKLATQYGVAVNTANAAVQILAAEGLVEIRAGSGARVREEPPLEAPDPRAELKGAHESLRRVQGELDSVKKTLKRISDSL